MPRSEPVASVRGVRDLLPRDLAPWRVVEQSAERCAERFGYQPIVTPIIEHAELIERAGEDSDAFSKELYRFQDGGGRQIALRPEATAGVVRAYFEHGLDREPQPSRLYLIGPMFRYDRPQKGRYRQFYQLDVEAIGSAHPALDAEVIELARDWLADLGIGSTRLELNSIGDAQCRPAYLDELRAYYRPLKDTLSEDSRRRLEHNPLRLLDSKAPQDQSAKAGAPRVTERLCDDCAAHWAMVRGLLDSAGIEYVVNPHLVRGLDYYTRTVFELYPAEAHGQQDALAGGGRYDGLAEALGRPSTPAVGFASGLDRVTNLMAATTQETVAPPAPDVMVVPDGDLPLAASEVARICRTVRSVQVDYDPRSLKAKMRSAHKLRTKWVVLITAEDAQARRAQLRDMTAGDQAEVTWDELPRRLA